MREQKDIQCINCGRPLQGEENFCPQCGQKNDIKRVSVKEMIFHFFGGFFAFDNLFFRTLKPLLFKPGLVSKEYVDGKRKKYTNPFIFLLHSAIVFFSVGAILDIITSDVEVKLWEEEFNYSIEKNIDSVFSLPDKLVFFKDTTISLQKKEVFFKNMYKKHLKLEQAFKDKNKDSDQGITFSNLNENKFSYLVNKKLKLLQLNYEVDFKDSLQLTIPEKLEKKYDIKSKIKKYSIYSEDNLYKPTNESLKALKEPITKWNVFLYERIKKSNLFQSDMGFGEDEFIDRLVSNIPMSLFIVLPLFTLVFSLLYFRQPFSYTEHLIFVFNMQSALFWILLVEHFIPKSTDILNSIFLLLFLYYLYKSLRVFYRQSRFKTILKFFIISISYGLFILIGLSVLSTIAIMM